MAFQSYLLLDIMLLDEVKETHPELVMNEELRSTIESDCGILDAHIEEMGLESLELDVDNAQDCVMDIVCAAFPLTVESDLFSILGHASEVTLSEEGEKIKVHLVYRDLFQVV